MSLASLGRRALALEALLAAELDGGPPCTVARPAPPGRPLSAPAASPGAAAGIGGEAASSTASVSRTCASSPTLVPPGPIPSPPSRRAALLEALVAARERPLDRAHALAAVKLRCAAELHCPKNEWSRLKPRWPAGDDARTTFDRLAALDVDVLIADVEADPSRYDRTLLTDVAQHHLVEALNFDVERFEEGLHRAGRLEGMHSVAGRMTTAAAAALSLGVGAVPGAGGLLETAKEIVKVAAHQLPANIVNPVLTGTLRTITDVKETFERVGGQPVVSPAIETSPDMAALSRLIRQRRHCLSEAVARFESARGTPAHDDARVALIDAFFALHDAAGTEYKRRIGLNRTQTYSKGWGTAVNALASAGAVVSVTVPGAGQIAGPVIAALCIPLQWGAGYLDERRVKHRYNLRANTKWGDFLTADAGRLHYKDLDTTHISEAALRRAFVTQPEMQVAAIREVYEDALGQLVRERLEISAHAPEGSAASVAARRADVAQRLAAATAEAADFESFDGARWAAIDPSSLIGRCLDDLDALERATRQSRLRKPGEGAQVLQRYAQVLQGGLSTGTMLPAVDGLMMSDLPAAESRAAGIAMGTAGGAAFTASTGEVRMGKAANKKTLAAPVAASRGHPSADDDWRLNVSERRVDLSGTAAYDDHHHSGWDKAKRVMRTLPASMFGGPAGLVHLARAKVQRRLAGDTLREAIASLDAAGEERLLDPSAGGRNRGLASLKDRFLHFKAVRRRAAEA